MNTEREGESREVPLYAHRNRSWLAEVNGHGQRRRRLDRKTLDQLEERTEALRKEILDIEGSPSEF